MKSTWKPNPALLHAPHMPSQFRSCWNARGSYHTLHFVLRLRPDIHAALDTAGSGIRLAREVTDEQVQAFSTYLHETIHWWQHVGSTLGLVLSMLQPAHTHANRQRLLRALEAEGPIKSLKRLEQRHADSPTKAAPEDQSVTYVVNNWHDLEFFRLLTVDPAQAEAVAQDPFFETVGHAYHMTLEANAWLLAATVDPTHEVLPDPRQWRDAIRALKAQQVEGFCREAPVHVPPLGAKEIFEGQARFSQLQYLFGASGGSLTWADLKASRMLDGEYVHAFEAFLAILQKEEWPDNPMHPLVGLFLLICDLAMNPAEGILYRLELAHTLIRSTDPGWRFVALCEAARAAPATQSAIKEYSASEYWETSDLLSGAISSPSPRSMATTVVEWSKHHEGWRSLREEDATFEFSRANLPIRLFLARFLRYQIDKLQTPHFFCWPGRCVTGYRESLPLEQAMALFDEHGALFVDKPDGDVYPRIMPGRNADIVDKVFNDFYVWVCIYELTRQWIADDGPFNYDFGWLTSRYSQGEIKDWAAGHFKSHYFRDPDNFQILTPQRP